MPDPRSAAGKRPARRRAGAGGRGDGAARRLVLSASVLVGCLAVIVVAGQRLRGREETRAAGEGEQGEAVEAAVPREAASEERAPLPVVAWAQVLEAREPAERSRRFFMLLAATPAGALPAVLENVLALPEGEERSGYALAVADRWAGLDPRGALRFFEAEPGRDAEATMRLRVFATWARRDPEDALDAALDVSEAALRREALGSVVRSRAADDPKDAFRMLLALPAEACDQGVLGPELLRRWARQDPGEAARALQELPLALQGPAAGAVAAGWATGDPEAALRWVQSLPASDGQQAALAEVVESWGARDPEAAAAYVEQYPAGAGRVRMLRSVARGIAGVDAEAALAWVEGNAFADEDRAQALADVLRTFGQRAPREALERAGRVEGFDSGEICQEILRGWLAVNRTEPLAWVSELSDERRLEWMPLVLEALSRDDPKLAGEYAVALAPEDGGKAALAAARASADPREVLRWSGELEDAGLRAEVTGWAVKHWAELDREAAATYALRAEDAGVRSVLWGAVVERWLQEDPVWVGHWLETLPPSEATPGLYGQVAAEWIRFDPVSASQWVAELPSGGSRDAAIGSLVEQIAPWDRERALHWAAALDDNGTRLSTVIRLLEEEARQDLPRALQMLEGAGLPAETRAAIRYHLGAEGSALGRAPES